MNLWVKRATRMIGQSMVAALFFLSCQEADQLGFKANERFTVNYIEIPLKSSVFIQDSVTTAGWNDSPAYHYLLGKYDDPDFGEITSSIFTQFYFEGKISDSIKFSSYDSISLQLRFDYRYLYGPAGDQQQNITIYELADTLPGSGYRPYLPSYLDIPLSPTPIGSRSYELNSIDFGDYYAKLLAGEEIILADAEDIARVTKRFLLDDDLGQRIFDRAFEFQFAADSLDSALVNYRNFREEFKGIGIVPELNDRMARVDLGSSASKIVVHFHHTNNNVRDSLVLRFHQVTGAHKITANRAGSPYLADLNDVATPFFPADDYRYIQNGTGITTAIDLDSFLIFADTIPTMIINSAELVINDVTYSTLDSLSPPKSLFPRFINDDYRFTKFSDVDQVFSDYGFLIYTGNTELNPNLRIISIASDRGNPNPLVVNYSENAYKASMTMFAQKLYENRNSETVLSKFALYSVSPQAVGKTVHRVKFDKNNIKLKVYYTIPTNILTK